MLRDEDLVVGTSVIVIELTGTDGTSIDERHLIPRRVGATGVLGRCVPGHGGDWWWVIQEDCAVSVAYNTEELARL